MIELALLPHAFEQAGVKGVGIDEVNVGAWIAGDEVRETAAGESGLRPELPREVAHVFAVGARPSGVFLLKHVILGPLRARVLPVVVGDESGIEKRALAVEVVDLVDSSPRRLLAGHGTLPMPQQERRQGDDGRREAGHLAEDGHRAEALERLVARGEQRAVADDGRPGADARRRRRWRSRRGRCPRLRGTGDHVEGVFGADAEGDGEGDEIEEGDAHAGPTGACPPSTSTPSISVAEAINAARDGG